MAQTRNGARQITNFYVVGDTPDLQSLLIPKPAFALQALTDCVILRIPHPHIRALSHSFPALMEAFWRETVRDADIVAQWVVNVGCRDAKTRLCHLFCEMAVRSGKEEGNTFEYDFPVTQIQLADATGLSTVHTNRSLQQIRRDRVVEFREGKVVVHDWTALREMADFDIGYLAVAAPIRFSN
jgi:CRP-like cAMP-binding protein